MSHSATWRQRFSARSEQGRARARQRARGAATHEARCPKGWRARTKVSIDEVTRPFYERVAQTQARCAEARATEAICQTASKSAVPPPTPATISRSSARSEGYGTNYTRLTPTATRTPTGATARQKSRREKPRVASPQEAATTGSGSKIFFTAGRGRTRTATATGATADGTGARAAPKETTTTSRYRPAETALLAALPAVLRRARRGGFRTTRARAAEQTAGSAVAYAARLAEAKTAWGVAACGRTGSPPEPNLAVSAAVTAAGPEAKEASASAAVSAPSEEAV